MREAEPPGVAIAARSAPPSGGTIDGGRRPRSAAAARNRIDGCQGDSASPVDRDPAICGGGGRRPISTAAEGRYRPKAAIDVRRSPRSAARLPEATAIDAASRLRRSRGRRDYGGRCRRPRSTAARSNVRRRREASANEAAKRVGAFQHRAYERIIVRSVLTARRQLKTVIDGGRKPLGDCGAAAKRPSSHNNPKPPRAHLVLT